MPVAGYAVDRLVLGHRREAHAIGEPHARELKRQKHRRSGRIGHAAAPSKPALVILDEPGIPQFEVGVPAPLTSREQGVGELPRFEDGIPRDILEPLHSIASRALQLERFQTPLRLIRLQPCLDIVRTRYAGHERHRVFHRQLGAGADPEMRRVRRIAYEHDILMMPLPAQYPVEIQPGGAAKMVRVAHQSISAQVFGEERLAESDRLLTGAAVEAVRAPGLLARFDDYRGDVAAELLRMDLKPAMLGLFEREGKGGQLLARPEPNEAALADGNIRPECRRMTRPNLAVDAVGRDDEIGIGERLQVADFSLKALLDAQRTRPLLKDIEQPPPADSAEAGAVRTNRLAAKMHVHGIPVMKSLDDRIMRLRIRGLEARHGLIREDDAPPKRIVGAIALIDLDLYRGRRLLQQDGAVKARRTAAYEHHSFHGRTIDPDTLDVKYMVESPGGAILRGNVSGPPPTPRTRRYLDRRPTRRFEAHGPDPPRPHAAAMHAHRPRSHRSSRRPARASRRTP